MKGAILITISLIWNVHVEAQINLSFLLPFLDESEINILDSRGLKMIFPQGFERGYFDLECFEDSPFLWSLLSCRSNKVISQDGNCMSFIPIYKFFPGNGPDSLLARKHFENWEYRIEHFHIDHIKSSINIAYGKQAAANWKNYVTYFETDQAKEIFNADTAITFDVKLTPDQYFMDKYTLVRFLFLQKKGRFFNMVVSLYSDQAVKDRERYDMLNNSILRYIN